MPNFNKSSLMRERKIRKVAREIMELLEKSNLGLAPMEIEGEDREIKICLIENMDRPYCLPIQNLELYYDVNVSSTPLFKIDEIILS